MKQYVIDELRPSDQHKVKTYLDETYGPCELGSIYWIPLAPECYSDVQREHVTCQPFYFAIELHPQAIVCELLVRTRERIRCGCIAYADPRQRAWIIELVDALFEDLQINT
jgi:hypothetical protein